MIILSQVMSQKVKIYFKNKMLIHIGNRAVCRAKWGGRNKIVDNHVYIVRRTRGYGK